MIHRYESAGLAPDDHTLRSIARTLALSRDSLEWFAAALPAAQAYASTVRPFSERLSALVEAYGGRAQFADAVGLSDRITEEQLNRMLGGAPPGERLGSYLNAFTSARTRSDYWMAAVNHALLLGSEPQIELSPEEYTSAREERLRQIVSEPVGNVPALARMMRFARESAGLTQGELAKIFSSTPVIIGFWEAGRSTPALSDLRRIHGGKPIRLSEAAVALLAAALPAGRANVHSLRHATFGEHLNRLIDEHGGGSEFLNEVGLSSHITPAQLDRLSAGAPPGKVLATYLSAFASLLTRSDSWMTAARHALAAGSGAPIELSSDAYGAARESMLQRMESEVAAENGLSAFARMLRFARESIGLSRRDLAAIARVGEISISRWERGEAIPALPSLRAVALRLRLSREGVDVILAAAARAATDTKRVASEPD